MLIVALDPPFSSSIEGVGEEIVNSLNPVVSGFKIGLPYIFEYGLEKTRRLRQYTDKELIADLKLADIGHIMSMIVNKLAENGFDSVIAHGFVGVKGALSELKSTCDRLGLKLILVVSMSHPGSMEYIDRHLNELVNNAIELNVHGVVAPATRPSIIRKVREMIGEKIKIYSPGIGVQGAEPGDALCAGADYEIIGRAITNSSNPYEAAIMIKNKQDNRVRSCRG
ncbi:MAG: orotidine-5'-phosphate decarboxylase [Desulfurococcaceae archaeon]